MKILEIIHSNSRFPFNNRKFFAARGDETAAVRLFAGEPPPGLREYDALIVYGGPMSAYDEGHHPWILDELRYLETWLKADRPILGICLGSQLLARTLGAAVYRSRVPEFGFKELRLTEEGAADPALGKLGDTDHRFLGIEWHSDAWDLPSGATRLAESEAWPNEAFRYGDSALAIQFHLEFTSEQIASFLAEGEEDIPADPQREEPDSFATPGPRYGAVKRSMELVLEGLLGAGGSG